MYTPMHKPTHLSLMQTHTCTLQHTHTQSPARLHTCTNLRARRRPHVQKHTPLPTDMLTQASLCAPLQTQAALRSLWHVNPRASACTHCDMQGQTHSQIPAPPHMHICAQGIHAPVANGGWEDPRRCSGGLKSALNPASWQLHLASALAARGYV